MLQLGKTQTLRVVKKMNFGAYLSEEPNSKKEDQVLLPRKQVPEGIEIGDPIEVFLYKDSADRPIATTAHPKLELHEVAMLEIRDTTRIGAFLDWGLEKDLFLPYHEQRGKIRKGMSVLVALYIDKSGRLCATMNVYPYLEDNSPYKVGDIVEGRVYELSRNFGVFVAVDDRYSALVPHQEAHGKFEAGEVRKFRVTGVRDDGRLNLSTQKKAYLQMDTDAEMIEKRIGEYGGVLPFDDRVDPEVIDQEFGISKAAFKRAVGRLMKEGKVEKRDGKLFLREKKA